MSEHEPRAARVQHFVRQARLLPRRVDVTERNVLGVLDRLAAIEAHLDDGIALADEARADVVGRIEELVRLVDARATTTQDATDAAIAGLGGEVHALAADVAALRDDLPEHQVLPRIADGAARDAELARLLAASPAPAALEPGLSILVHAGGDGDGLRSTVAAALELLDALGLAGELLVVADADVPHEADDDPRLHRVATGRPLGAARARRVQARLARFRHALVLDAGTVPDPAGVGHVYEATAAQGASMACAPVVVRTKDGQAVRVAGVASLPPEGLSLRDVAQMRELGGSVLDDLADALEHHAHALRLASRGDVVLQVPRVAGHRVAEAAPPTADGAGRAELERVLARSGARRLVVAARPQQDPPTGPRVLLASGGGVANIGDDMIMLGLLARLREALGSDASITVASDGDRPLEIGLDATWACTLRELDDRAASGIDLVGLDRIDLCVLGGGGTIAAPFSREVRPRAALARALAARGVPLIATGQGLGPLGPQEEDDLAEIARAATSFAVRDARSAELLAGLGFAGAPVLIDDAVGLAPAPPAAVDAALVAAGIDPARPFAIATLRAASYAADEQATARWAAAIDAWAVAHALPVALLPMSRWPAPDEAALGATFIGSGELAARWTLVDAGLDARLAAGILARGAAVAAASYHAGLLAACAGAPTAFLAAGGYQGAKCAGAAALLGLSPAVVLDEAAGAEALAAALACAPPDAAHVAGLVRARDAALVAALRSALPALPGPEFGENGRPEA